MICIFDNVIPHEKRPGDKILTKYFTGSIDGAIVMSQTVLDDLKTFRTDIPVKLSVLIPCLIIMVNQVDRDRGISST